MSSLPCGVFGCSFLFHSHNPNLNKLEPRVLKCVFIGYPHNKRKGTNVIIVKVVVSISPWMSHFMK